MQTYYENWKKSKSGSRRLKSRVLDPDGILTGNGYIEGVYEISYYNIKTNTEFSAYIGQAGSSGLKVPGYVASNVYERLLQHLKRWLGGSYLTYWTGLDENDSDWRIKVSLLCEESNHAKRLQLESKFIEERHPLLQDTKNGKYQLYPTKYGYKRNDLCISPWNGQRKAAFRDKLAELNADKIQNNI